MGRKKKPDLETAKSNLFSNTEAFFNYYDQLIKSNKLNISKSKKKWYANVYGWFTRWIWF